MRVLSQSHIKAMIFDKPSSLAVLQRHRSCLSLLRYRISSASISQHLRTIRKNRIPIVGLRQFEFILLSTGHAQFSYHRRSQNSSTQFSRFYPPKTKYIQNRVVRLLDHPAYQKPHNATTTTPLQFCNDGFRISSRRAADRYGFWEVAYRDIHHGQLVVRNVQQCTRLPILG